MTAYPHWVSDFAGAAGNVGLGVTLADAAERVNSWIAEINAAR